MSVDTVKFLCFTFVHAVKVSRLSLLLLWFHGQQ